MCLAGNLKEESCNNRRTIERVGLGIKRLEVSDALTLSWPIRDDVVGNEAEGGEEASRRRASRSLRLPRFFSLVFSLDKVIVAKE